MSFTGMTHTVQYVDFDAGELVVRGERAGRVVEDRLVSYGKAYCIEVRPEKTDARKEERETVGITIRILDKRGSLVSGWNGDVEVKLSGPAFLILYRTDNAVPVAGGIGKSFVTATGEPGVVSIDVSCASLETGTTSVNFE